MSDLRPKAEQIKLGNNEYGLRFTLNAIDEIQDHFDAPISKLVDILGDERKSFKAIKYILTVTVNEDIQVRKDEGEDVNLIDEKFVGRYIDTKNMAEITNALLRSFSTSIPETEEEDIIPNEVSE